MRAMRAQEAEVKVESSNGFEFDHCDRFDQNSAFQ